MTLNEVLFAAAAGPKIIQALGGGAIDLSFVNSTAALLGMAGGAIPLRFISIPTDPSRLFALLSAQEIDIVPQARRQEGRARPAAPRCITTSRAC